MPPNEQYTVECLEPNAGAGERSSRLPMLATPIAGEALPAWLHRFAAKLDLPPSKLILDSDEGEVARDDTWWRYPTLGLLERIAARTGTKVSVLKTMTFSEWQEDRTSDEVMRRFARGRVRGERLPLVPTRRYGLCLKCLKSDPVPYLRRHWTLGWVVACEQHGVLLQTTCRECWATFMLPLLKDTPRFEIYRCSRTGCPIKDLPHNPAHPAALRLQSSLIAGRSAGVVQWPSLDRLEWAVAVALIDFVLDIAWTRTDPEVRRRCYQSLERELGCERPLKGSCHDGLTIASWTLEEWPTRARWLSQELKAPPLEQRLTCRKLLDPGTREKLAQLLVR